MGRIGKNCSFCLFFNIFVARHLLSMSQVGLFNRVSRGCWWTADRSPLWSSNGRKNKVIWRRESNSRSGYTHTVSAMLVATAGGWFKRSNGRLDKYWWSGWFFYTGGRWGLVDVDGEEMSGSCAGKGGGDKTRGGWPGPPWGRQIWWQSETDVTHRVEGKTHDTLGCEEGDSTIPTGLNIEVNQI